MSVHVSLEIDAQISGEEILHLMALSGFMFHEATETHIEAFDEHVCMPVFWDVFDENELKFKVDSPQYPPHSSITFFYAYDFWDECTEKIKLFMALLESKSPAFFIFIYEEDYDQTLAIRDENGLRNIMDL